MRFHIPEMQLEIITLRAKVRELEEAATTDPLTGLLNRRGGEAALETAAKRRTRYGTATSAILIDLDHFKQINDTQGHAKGDEILRSVADAIRQGLRATDTAIRWGGEEILIVTENNQAGATQLAERLRLAIERLWQPAVTASFGVAEYDDPDGDGMENPMSSAIDAADIALYRAKALGRNRVVEATR